MSYLTSIAVLGVPMNHCAGSAARARYVPAARRVENPGDAEPALRELGERPRERARQLVKQWEQAALAEALLRD